MARVIDSPLSAASSRASFSAFAFLMLKAILHTLMVISVYKIYIFIYYILAICQLKMMSIVDNAPEPVESINNIT
jgi:hypothetical protein